MPSKFLNLSTDDTLGGNSPSDVVAVSQKAIKKYVDDHSGGGGSVSIDNKSITTNTSNQLQTVGVIDQNNTSTALKVWHGTQAAYDNMLSHDANTRYYTDGGINTSLLEVLYPVGSIYITTNVTCPLASLISGSTWTLESTGIVTAGDIPCKGNGMTIGCIGKNEATGGLAKRTDAYGDLMPYSGAYGLPAGSTISSQGNLIIDNSNRTIGITTDPTKSGIIADTSSLTLSVNIFERTA